MTRSEYNVIENHMLCLMRDSAHDKHHIYRVLYSAIDIAMHEKSIDFDVLIAACLLHDIGREQQFSDLNLCHAQIGSEMAFDFLMSISWDEKKASYVKECISSHRYRGDNKPQSIEAKILFDADKLDVTGATGIARTLIYEGQVSEPLYILDENGHVIVDGGGAEISSFFQEYNYKLNKLYDAFYTTRAKQIAANRQAASKDFYNALHKEVTQNHENGANQLSGLLL
ncbi:HD domain-containing protein [Oscillospiraceae bacterium OttesenSCG-928-G22]|nr:HD domain-containing protein [Oscillospiraceae bacterium OttesenSCG-928-G22]